MCQPTIGKCNHEIAAQTLEETFQITGKSPNKQTTLFKEKQKYLTCSPKSQLTNQKFFTSFSITKTINKT